MFYMSLHPQHIKLIEAVNDAEDEHTHFERMLYLRAWRDGVEATGRKLDLCAADMHYLNQGIDRPMCCGVWLDWVPKTRPITGDCVSRPEEDVEFKRGGY